MMETAIKEYSGMFGTVRTTVVDGKVMFCLLDVAKALEYANPAKAVIDHCKVVSKIGTTTTNQYDGVMVKQIKYGEESEVYRLILKAKTKRAEMFQDWVCNEVLPDIRKHGAYMTPETIEKTLADPDFIIGLATKLKDAQAAQQRLEAEKAQLKAENARLETTVEIQQPFVDFSVSVANSDSLITVSDLAKIICQNGVNIGGVRLFEWLRQNGYLCTAKGIRNCPTQESINRGLFRLVEYPITTSTGTKISYTPKVTTKGQLFFVHKFTQIKKQTK